MPIRQAYLNGLIPSRQRATILSFDSMMGSSGGVWTQPVLGRAADVWGYAPSYLIGRGSRRSRFRSSSCRAARTRPPTRSTCRSCRSRHREPGPSGCPGSFWRGAVSAPSALAVKESRGGLRPVLILRWPSVRGGVVDDGRARVGRAPRRPEGVASGSRAVRGWIAKRPRRGAGGEERRPGQMSTLRRSTGRAASWRAQVDGAATAVRVGRRERSGTAVGRRGPRRVREPRSCRAGSARSSPATTGPPGRVPSSGLSTPRSAIHRMKAKRRAGTEARCPPADRVLVHRASETRRPAGSSRTAATCAAAKAAASRSVSPAASPPVRRFLRIGVGRPAAIVVSSRSGLRV